MCSSDLLVDFLEEVEHRGPSLGLLRLRAEKTRLSAEFPGNGPHGPLSRPPSRAKVRLKRALRRDLRHSSRDLM